MTRSRVLVCAYTLAVLHLRATERRTKMDQEEEEEEASSELYAAEHAKQLQRRPQVRKQTRTRTMLLASSAAALLLRGFSMLLPVVTTEMQLPTQTGSTKPNGP